MRDTLRDTYIGINEKEEIEIETFLGPIGISHICSMHIDCYNPINIHDLI